MKVKVSKGVKYDLKLIHAQSGTVWALTQISIELVCMQEWVFDTSLQKIANVNPAAAVKQSAKVLGPLVLIKYMLAEI